MEGDRAVDLRNRLVHFRICDVYYPEPTKILLELHGNDVLQGTVMEISDSGAEPAAFAMVRVEGLREPVIVAVQRIQGVL